MTHQQMRFALFVICTVIVVNSVHGRTLRDNPDAHLSTPELIVKYGYPAEIHRVVTEDGYILHLHRIPFGKGQNPDKHRPPVLVLHGIMSSSTDWVIMGPGTALAYLLADAGYDVWLGNARGNVYSRDHVSLDPNLRKFWQFSWHEKGKYDLPAMIDYILMETQEEKLHLIGYSMGTTMFYVMGSERPEYNNKIKAMYSMAPIAFISHTKSPLLRLAAEFEPLSSVFFELMGGMEFLPKSELISMLGTELCKEESISSELCLNIIFLTCGYDSVELDKKKIPAILGHVPAGSSSMEFLHYGQEVESGKFRRYDHGHIENMINYGQLEPPDYDLNIVTAPVAIFYSANDWLATEPDVDELYKKLGNPIGKFLVPFKKFNHLDYMWAKHAPQLVYNDIIALMNKTESS